MKSTNLKVFLFALSSLAFSATFAQDDTTKKPNPDTSQLPKHDTTSMTTSTHSLSRDVAVISSFVTKDENVATAKLEAILDNSSKKSFAKISA
jgi:hypothetical protein